MSTVMINCPVKRRPVSTGIETEASVFRGLPRTSAVLRCPACDQDHLWTCDEAWLDGEPAPSAADSVRAA